MRNMSKSAEDKLKQNQINRCLKISQKIGSAEAHFRILESDVSSLKRDILSAQRKIRDARDSTVESSFWALAEASLAALGGVGVGTLIRLANLAKRIKNAGDLASISASMIPIVSSIREAQNNLERLQRERSEFQSALALAGRVRRRAERVRVDLERLQQEYNFHGCAGI